MSDSDSVTAPQLTILLKQWQQGDKNALDALVPAMYQELRRLAAAQLNRDQGASIQCTELISEAYLKLIDVEAIDWRSRSHFFSMAARTMRRVLVERYRFRNTDKRGQKLTILTFDDNMSGTNQSSVALDSLDDALNELEVLDPRQAEIVTLKFFGGLKAEEIAEALSISERTVKREWSVARLWLFRSLQQAD
ncbi:MAG: DNA-directed RNA polymerase sigma-70 factor [Nitrospirales bacterium]|nr:MAG: DNA-directed RNA polymerase sigma-70 factor [Nitrospirales bacterium]